MPFSVSFSLGEFALKYISGQQVQGVQPAALQADQRHAYTTHKGQPAWEAELIVPASKFVLSHVQGRRDETLIRRLLSDGARRIRDRHHLDLLIDGDDRWAMLFPELFGRPYQPRRNGSSGRFPSSVRFRIPRTLEHVQLIKHRQARHLADIRIRYPPQ